MALKVYNTLTGKKEEFLPLKPGAVNMYVCGITPYDECHLGHARCYVAFDVVKRWLEHGGMKVRHVQNFTDIDDKIIERAAKKNVSPAELAGENIEKYFEVMDKLNVKRADYYPRVTEHIKEIITAVGELVNNGFAYEADGSIYYEVDRFDGYGKLSGRRKEDLLAGARVEVNEKKKNPLDFALWKKAADNDVVSWDSPWGKGRPGWHIECSVMSAKYSSEGRLDIHGGGMDLIFPHHENEVAQSEALTGREFSKYWLHNGFVNINREKMSKSLGNAFSLSEVTAKYGYAAVRFFLLTQHYRSPLDFSDDKIIEAGKSMANLMKVVNYDSRGGAPSAAKSAALEEAYGEFLKLFNEAMNDDFNTAGAIGQVFKFIKTLEARAGEGAAPAVAEKLKQLLEGVLGLDFRAEGVDVDKVRELIGLREIARKNGNWKESDALRARLKELGVALEDTPSGTLWKPIKNG